MYVCSHTSFSVSTACSIPLRLGGVMAQRSTDLGSPISNLLVCNTRDSKGHLYIHVCKVEKSGGRKEEKERKRERERRRERNEEREEKERREKREEERRKHAHVI